MENMPAYNEGFITLWRNGSWVQVPLSEMPKIIEEDNRDPKDSTELPAGA